MISFIYLFIDLIFFFTTSTLNFPTSSELYKFWRCIFERLTLSWSAIPIVPTPALLNVSITGQPSPPAPTTKTFELIIFFCPATPTFFNTIWREYLSIIFFLNYLSFSSWSKATSSSYCIWKTFNFFKINFKNWC